MNILLDYFFPITAIEPTPEASTGFLKQVCVVAKPASEVPTGVITLCTTLASAQALVDSAAAKAEIAQLFSAGMNRVYVLPSDDLDLAEALDGAGEFFTLLISSDFSGADVDGEGFVAGVKASRKIEDITYTAKTAGAAGNSITINYNSGGTSPISSSDVSVSDSAITVAIEDGVSTAAEIAAAIEAKAEADALVDVEVDEGDETDPQAVFGDALALSGGVDQVASEEGLDLGDFAGVVGISETDDTFLEAQAVIEKRVAFHVAAANKAKNMFFAFGKLLSNALNWTNQQYIQMPFADDVDTLGEANALFDEKISFVISDDEFGERLALFAAGGKAIIAPYIKRNLELDMQSAALSYISGNQPQYTKKQATLLEDTLQKVIDSYIERQWIEAGTVEVKLEQSNFIASGYINISEPKALWRIFGEMRQTL